VVLRDRELQRFLSAYEIACASSVGDPRSQLLLHGIFQRLMRVAPRRVTAGCRLPVCDHLAAAQAVTRLPATLRLLIEALAAIDPHLEWQSRSSGPGASANFTASHANAMIAGPGGLEERDDLWLGVSLLAPHVRYPDHTHPPEETYLVLSEGDFMQGADNWMTPGIGGSLYNPPGILHAMRSGDAPLLAIWALLPDQIAR
jgi:hypothetical protein